MRQKNCATINYIEHLLILASAVTGCVSISAFFSVGIAIGIKSLAVGLNICAITKNSKVIKKYNSTKKKKE